MKLAMNLSLRSCLVLLAAVPLLITGCGKSDSAVAPDPGGMEGGSGLVRPKEGDGAKPPLPPEEREAQLTPEQITELPYDDPRHVRYAEKIDTRTDVVSEELPVSRGGVVPDIEWYGGAGDSPDPDPAVQPREGGRTVRVWYATNRAMELRPTPEDWDPPGTMRPGYLATRDNDNRMHLGSVICFVPDSRPKGTLGSSWVTRLIKGEDDRIKIEQVLLEQDTEWFYESLRRRIARAPENDRSILVYVHGYKNSFDSAALRAAQLAVDLNVPGLTAFYSWPSADSVDEYSGDEAAVETAEKHLTEFLTRLSRDTGASRINIIAHSMGNRLVARTMQRILMSNNGADKQVKFGQVFLAAPDIDVDTFNDLAEAYPKLSERTTLYISKRDMALEASAWKHSFARVGYAPPIAVIPGIDTVEVTGIDVSALGHGYVAEAEQVLTDIALLLRKDNPPGQRFHMRPQQTDKGGNYWLLSP
ncbi:MAG: alpha/beta hydrolase [Phycisphaerales bacterium]